MSAGDFLSCSRTFRVIRRHPSTFRAVRGPPIYFTYQLPSTFRAERETFRPIPSTFCARRRPSEKIPSVQETFRKLPSTCVQMGDFPSNSINFQCVSETFSQLCQLIVQPGGLPLTSVNFRYGWYTINQLLTTFHVIKISSFNFPCIRWTFCELQ